MASDGLLELIKTVRAVLIMNSAISKAGVFYGRAPQGEDLPYVLFSATPLPQSRRFGESVRLYRVIVKACATDANGKGANEIAQPMVAAALGLLSDSSAQDRLNAKLTPLGWNALTPMEAMPLEPYYDQVAQKERWFFGNIYDIRIQAAGE